MFWNVSPSFGMLMPNRSYSAGTYRYAFNTQEKDDEICGAGNTNTALYWEYSTRLGRRWNLDPNPNLWESQYSVMGGNPIWRTDLLGDKWKTKADEAKAKDLNGKLESKKNNLNKLADKLSSKADKLAAKGKEEKAKTLRAKVEQARETASELRKAQDELSEIGANSTDYTFKEVNGTISFTYMDADGTIVMEFNSDVSAIHELKHGYQMITGELEGIPGVRMTKYHDAHDELEAYKRQYYFDPYSIAKTNSDVKINLRTSQDITIDFVINIYDNVGFAKFYPYHGSSRERKNKPGSPADVK